MFGLSWFIRNFTLNGSSLQADENQLIRATFQIQSQIKILFLSKYFSFVTYHFIDYSSQYLLIELSIFVQALSTICKPLILMLIRS